mmetsp:Transcript_18808/g.48827  ORF Transcript_18808/g.48827 Transcript_18808/m.48827 type:complete len:123 (+) Transcript_18808:330-698(+)
MGCCRKLRAGSAVVVLPFSLSAGSSDGAEAERLTSTSTAGVAIAAGVAGGGGSLPPRLRPPFKDRLPWSRWAGGYEMMRSGYVEAGMSEDHAAMVGPAPIAHNVQKRQHASDKIKLDDDERT